MSTTLDESLYSRQLYAIGKDTTQKLINSKLFVYGMRGVSIEILKNIILCGVGQITLSETPDKLLVTQNDIDLNYNYYLKSTDVDKSILDVMGKRLGELNPNVKINKYSKGINIGLLKQYQMVLFSTNNILDKTIITLTEQLHENNVPYIISGTYGVFGNIFCDFGENFTTYDSNGEKLLNGLILECTDDEIHCESNHNLSRDMIVNLKKSKTNEILKSRIIKIIDKKKFKIDLNLAEMFFDSFEEIKTPETFKFKSFKTTLANPEFVLTDFKDFELSQKLHSYLMGNTTGVIFDKTIIDKLNQTKFKQFIPINSIIGGICANAIIAGICNKYLPINQFLYFGCLDLLDLVLNEIGMNKKFDENIFIVGAGALGCEHLKNLASYGFNIHITDMDSIEKSNLNRQFLFRNSDIGKPKSVQAKHAIKKMFPSSKVTSAQDKVCLETSNIYNEKFYSNISAVINALDNVPARIYVDSECIKYKKPLFESGTLGTKGNVQVILPDLTESYASTIDAPDDSIPVCTLKNHPYLIEHCIQWGKELFQSMFVEPFNIIKKQKDLSKISQTELEELDILSYKIESIDDINHYVIEKFNHLFFDNIQKILKEHPIDSMSVEDETRPYWSGTKKIPQSIYLSNGISSKDEFELNFIKSIQSIMCRIFKLELKLELKPESKSELKSSEKFSSIKDIIEFYKDYTFNIEEFEKDDDTNSHIDFIATVSNLRAQNYHIKPISNFEVKGIAGKIIPALSTTTSVISGLACLEYFKYLHSDKISVDKFNNYFVNIGTNFYGNSDPIECKYTQIGKLKINLWNKFTSTSQSVEELIEEFEEKYDIRVAGINCDSKVLFNIYSSSNTNTNTKFDRTIMSGMIDMIIEENNLDENMEDENMEDENISEVIKIYLI